MRLTRLGHESVVIQALRPPSVVAVVVVRREVLNDDAPPPPVRLGRGFDSSSMPSRISRAGGPVDGDVVATGCDNDRGCVERWMAGVF